MISAWLVWVLLVSIIILWYGFVDMVLTGIAEDDMKMTLVGLILSIPFSLFSFWLSVQFVQMYIELVY